MGQKWSVALIGCGGMGTTHNLALKALSEEMQVEVTAIADCRPEYLERGIAQWDGARPYRTGMELLEKEHPDIVYICLPSYLHAEHAVRAMRGGSHVFVEKPVCLSRQEGEELLRVQQETGVQAIAGQVVRSFSEYRYLKKVYDEKTYGELKSIIMQRISGKVNWGYENWFQDEKKSGGVILDLHIHDLDFLRYMIGEPESMEVNATTFDTGMMNQVVTVYRWKDRFAMAEGIWDVSPAFPFEASFRACFEEATLVYNGRKTPALSVCLADGTVLHPPLEEDVKMEDSRAGINLSDLGPYYMEDRYFLRCLREGKEMNRAPLREGVKSVELALREFEEAAKRLHRN